MQQNERMQPEMKTMTTNGEMEPTTVCTARAMALRDQGQYKLEQELVLVQTHCPHQAKLYKLCRRIRSTVTIINENNKGIAERGTSIPSL